MTEHHWNGSCCRECEADISWCDNPPKTQQLYPKNRQRPEPDYTNRSWGVQYHLAYDDGLAAWTQYYHTKLGARISAFLHYHIRSWGGRATLFDNRKEQYYG